jgi:hypothetical protein
MSEKVLDFTSKREENIEKKRRNFERVLFQNFLGAYTVIDQGGTIYPVSLVDISHDGCLFQVPWDMSKTSHDDESGREISMRMYFTKQSFVPVLLTVKNTREHVDKDGTTYLQYGCEFDKTIPSFKAIESFIDFMNNFAEVSTIDRDEKKVFFV